MRGACRLLPFFREFEGKRYCVLHIPSAEKAIAFKEALDKKLRNKDFDFRGVWFPEAPPLNRINFTEAIDRLLLKGCGFFFNHIQQKGRF